MLQGSYCPLPQDLSAACDPNAAATGTMEPRSPYPLLAILKTDPGAWINAPRRSGEANERHGRDTAARTRHGRGMPPSQRGCH